MGLDKEREQLIFQSLGLLEKMVAFDEVRSVWISPVPKTDSAVWVLVFITDWVNKVEDFTSLCKRRAAKQVEAGVSPEAVRVELLDELVGGNFLRWPAEHLIGDVLFLPGNWYEHNTTFYLETLYEFSKKGSLNKLRSGRKEAIVVFER